jgi:hypothetical protein
MDHHEDGPNGENGGYQEDEQLEDSRKIDEVPKSSNQGGNQKRNEVQNN